MIYLTLLTALPAFRSSKQTPIESRQTRPSQSDAVAINMHRMQPVLAFKKPTFEREANGGSKENVAISIFKEPHVAIPIG